MLPYSVATGYLYGLIGFPATRQLARVTRPPILRHRRAVSHLRWFPARRLRHRYLLPCNYFDINATRGTATSLPPHKGTCHRILGLDVAASGSATPWLREARRRALQLLHLVRRISMKSGGARTEMARLLVRAILQPRITYQAQFQYMTRARGH